MIRLFAGLGVCYMLIAMYFLSDVHFGFISNLSPFLKFAVPALISIVSSFIGWRLVDVYDGSKE